MSTLKVNAIESQAADSAPTIAGLQYPTAGALSNRNLIINGAMRVAQRGTSTTTGSGGYNTVDRWRSSQNSGGLGTNFHQSQSTDVPANQGFSNSLKHVNKSSQTVTASMGSWLEHKFEGQDLQQLKYGSANAVSLTVSFWVKSTATGTFCVQLYNFDSSRAQVKEYTINATETWEFKTLTFSGDTNTGITPIDDDNNDSGALKFIMGSGTEQHISADTWQDVTVGDRAYCTSNQNNEMITTADEEFYLTGIQLEVGEKATPFEHRSFGDELDKCKRYYQQVEYRGDGMISLGYSWTPALAMADMQFEKEMRATPTITLPSAGSTTGTIVFLTGQASHPSSIGSHAAYQANKYGYSVKATGYSGLTDDSATWLYPNDSTSFVTFKYNAEL